MIILADGPKGGAQLDGTERYDFARVVDDLRGDLVYWYGHSHTAGPDQYYRHVETPAPEWLACVKNRKATAGE